MCEALIPGFCLCRFGIPSPPVVPNHRDLLDILHQNRPLQRWPSGCGQPSQRSPCACVSIPNHFNSPKNQCFRRQIGYCPATLSSNRTTDDRFVSLNTPRQSRSCVIDHGTSQTVKHEPSGLVLASYLWLQLFGAKPRRMCRHQISCPKPPLNAHMATMHRRASHRRSMSTAPTTFIPKRFLDHPILFAPAFRADESLRPSALRQVLQAGSIRRELPPKLP